MAHQIHLVDVTLRDGQQSLAATRMTREQAQRVLDHTARAGYPVMELWGGAVLDSCIRFLNEDPWERLEQFRDFLPESVKIMALVRGQNLFAYQPYSDDLVIAFIKQAVESGVDVFRIFDALNDRRNLQTAILATKAYGAVAQAALSYTTSPVHTVDYFVNYARELESDGADQIAIKDMAGLLHPTTAVELIRKLKSSISVPLSLHTHTTTGVALLNVITGMMNGVDYIDTAITPFAGGSSHTPVEVLIPFAEELGLDHGLDIAYIDRAQKVLFEVFDELKQFIPYAGKFYRPVHTSDVDRKVVNQILKLLDAGGDQNIQSALTLSRELMSSLGYPTYNDKIFESQIPGGMITNLNSQLKSLGQMEILPQVLEEVPHVRADVGYVPLVTPTSQIVGSQAAFNVISGERYALVSNEFKMLLRGEFGHTPTEANPDVVRKVLGDNEQPLQYRPASYLHPVLEDTCQMPFIHSNKDLLLHLMLNQPADDFLQKRDDLLSISTDLEIGVPA